MSKKLNVLLALVAVASMLLSACGSAATATTAVVEPTKAPTEVPTKAAPTEAPTVAATEAPTAVATEAALSGAGKKICEVTDTGGIDDKSFNATAWAGLQTAATDFGVEVKYLESQQQTDYEKNIQAFIDEKCDLIITVGFLLADATLAAANANPTVNFAIIDNAYAEAPANILQLNYQTDQAAFLAGYVAAATTKTGKVATFGGMNIPTVTIFMDGFYQGVQYYNQENGTSVAVLGWDPANPDAGLFTGNFESTDDGRTMGETLMQEGADIIMPVAGPVGLGTAQAIKDAGNAWVIGVDTDWTVSAAEYKDIVLTSVMKHMEVSVYDATKQIIDGSFKGGNFIGTLENKGVGIAAITNTTVSSDLQAKLDAVTAGIIDGSIKTSPAAAQ